MSAFQIGGETVLVDDEDDDLLVGARWYLLRTGASIYVNDPRKGLLHRVLLGAGHGDEIDHRNLNGLDNRRCNLRFATRSQNCANRPKRSLPTTSLFKGVSWDPD